MENAPITLKPKIGPGPFERESGKETSHIEDPGEVSTEELRQLQQHLLRTHLSVRTKPFTRKTSVAADQSQVAEKDSRDFSEPSSELPSIPVPLITTPTEPFTPWEMPSSPENPRYRMNSGTRISSGDNGNRAVLEKAAVSEGSHSPVEASTPKSTGPRFLPLNSVSLPRNHGRMRKLSAPPAFAPQNQLRLPTSHAAVDRIPNIDIEESDEPEIAIPVLNPNLFFQAGTARLVHRELLGEEAVCAFREQLELYHQNEREGKEGNHVNNLQIWETFMSFVPDANEATKTGTPTHDLSQSPASSLRIKENKRPEMSLQVPQKEALKSPLPLPLPVTQRIQKQEHSMNSASTLSVNSSTEESEGNTGSRNHLSPQQNETTRPPKSNAPLISEPKEIQKTTSIETNQPVNLGALPVPLKAKPTIVLPTSSDPDVNKSTRLVRRNSEGSRILKSKKNVSDGESRDVVASKLITPKASRSGAGLPVATGFQSLSRGMSSKQNSKDSGNNSISGKTSTSVARWPAFRVAQLGKFKVLAALHPKLFELLNFEEVVESEDEDIIFDPSVGFYPMTSALEGDWNQGKWVAKSGSLAAAIEYLTRPDDHDFDFLSDFLYTFHYYAESIDVARLLICRYLQAKEGMQVTASPSRSERRKTIFGFITANSSSEKSSNASSNTFEKEHMIQLRVLNVFRKWVNEHPFHFRNSTELCLLLKMFFDFEIDLDFKKKSYITVTRRKVNDIMNGDSLPVPPPVIHDYKSAVINILQVDPDALANVITAIESEYMKKIQVHELFRQAWSNKDRSLREKIAPNVLAFINWFNRVAYGVASFVLLQENLKDRVDLLKKFIHVAHTCAKQHNYNTCFEIVAGLNLGAISKLKKTWKNLPKKYWEVWMKMNLLVSSESNYKVYRETMQHSVGFPPTVPVVPYLGMYLSNLTFIEDGNSTILSKNGQSEVYFLK